MALAIVHFIRRRPDTYWLWIILFLGPLGALDLLAGGSCSRCRAAAAIVQSLSRAAAGFANWKPPFSTILPQETTKSWPTCIWRKAISRKARAMLRQGDFVAHRFAGSVLPAWGLRRSNWEILRAAVPDLERVVRRSELRFSSRHRTCWPMPMRIPGNRTKAEALFQRSHDDFDFSETYYNYACFCWLHRKRNAEAREWAQKFWPRNRPCPDI